MESSQFQGNVYLLKSSEEAREVQYQQFEVDSVKLRKGKKLNKSQHVNQQNKNTLMNNGHTYPQEIQHLVIQDDSKNFILQQHLKKLDDQIKRKDKYDYFRLEDPFYLENQQKVVKRIWFICLIVFLILVLTALVSFISILDIFKESAQY